MRIFKSHIVKKILGVLVVMGCSGIFLNGYVGVGESAHAADGQQVSTIGTTGTTGSAVNTMTLRQILNMILKIIYLLLRPLLVVAGLALDNTLVYASIFHLDAPLRKFRNMMKNFANFTLGFMVLFAIIKGFFVQKDEKGGPMSIIKKTLIAGVLIQASRFLMAALVDISTIATYAVGGLPLSVMKGTPIGNQKILSVNSSIDLNKFSTISQGGDDFKMRYSTTYDNKPIKMSPCRVSKTYPAYVIGREFGDPEYSNAKSFEGTSYAPYEVCVLFGNQLVMRREGELFQSICTNIYNNTNCVNTGTKAGYDEGTDALVAFIGRNSNPLFTKYMVNLGSGSTQEGFVQGSDFFAASSSLTISDLIKQSKGFVGPLVTMYSSLLNFAQLTDTNVTSISETSGIFLIKTGIAIALFFPLLALAAVLIARVALLRLYIAGSPFLVIKKAFDLKLGGDIDKHLELGNVFKLVFAPVITVAALSISLIFMTALINGFKSGDNQHISSAVSENLQIKPIEASDPKNQAFQIGDSSSLEFKNFDRGGSLDRFSRLVVNFFAIGLLRTILFAAIKANELGKSIGGGIEKFGTNVFSTLPILPLGQGGERVGIGSAYNVLSGAPQRKIEAMQQKDTTKINKWLFPEEGTAGTTLTKEAGTTIVTSLGALTNPTKEAATKVFTANKIANPAENIAANEQIYYNALKDITDENKRKTAIAAIEAAKGDTTWYETMEKAEATTKAKTALEKLIGTPKTKADLETILTTDKNEKIEAYFKASGTTTYPITIGGTEYTITKTEDKINKTKFTYPITP